MAHQRKDPAVSQNSMSENELEGELHDSGARCCSRCSEGRCADVLRDQARSPCNSADGSRGGARKLCCAHSADVGVVQHVKRFPDKLQAYALGELYIARYTWIQGNRSRQIESISPQSRRSIGGRVAVVVEIKIDEAGIRQTRLRRQ